MKKNNNNFCEEKILEQVMTQLQLLRDQKIDGYSHDIFPSAKIILRLMSQIKELIFSDYYCQAALNSNGDLQQMRKMTNAIFPVLKEQILRGLSCCCKVDARMKLRLAKKAQMISWNLFEQLPQIRELLNCDAQSAFDGDPACESTSLPILCYPGLLSLTYHRVANRLYQLKVPVLPRMISELAHSQTGIDIHPGAEIGPGCFIDHGVGVVIGETAIIGCNVKMYQGVTLGAKSFPVDKNGKIIRGIKRHPTVGNDVTIYSNAVILGDICIGDKAVIGGNVWLTHSVPANSRIYRSSIKKHDLVDGNGI